MKALAGKVSLVTGGSRGIGRAIVLGLAEAGSDVVFNYQSSQEAAEALVREVAGKEVRGRAFRADVSSEADVQAMISEVASSFGRIDILVNNAGITRDRSFLKMGKDAWDEVLRVNLDGLFIVTHAALPTMLRGEWGRVINISSIVGQTGNFGQANYAVSKGGIIAFTKTLARELARKNITVNAVAPGFIETDMTKDLSSAALDQVKALTPMGRLGRAEEVASAVVFLASPQASYVTGQVIAVNGGMYM